MSTAQQQPLFVEQPVQDGELPNRLGHATIDYVPTRDILTRATGFMDAYDYTLNPYAGCSFGCTYCYAAFFSHGAEKRDNWGRWVSVKENAIQRLEQRRKGLNGKRIYMSSVTDPYQPIERKLRLTEGLLRTMARWRPKLVVQTRSPDVVRDVPVFRQICAKGGRVQVNITVTTDDEDVRRTFEPYCPSNRVRLRAAKELQSQGIQTCITMTPLLLVRDSVEFTEHLLKTGVTRFIAQPFHFRSGKFIAGTRSDALRLMEEKLGSDSQNFRDTYLDHYLKAREVFLTRLPELGEGKAGFQPPF